MKGSARIAARVSPAPDLLEGPVLRVSDAAVAVAFYVEVFGGLPLQQECLLDGRLLRADLALDGYRLTVSEWEEPEPADAYAVLTITRTDPHDLVRRALVAGARIESADGPALPTLRDPAGQRWIIATTPAA